MGEPVSTKRCSSALVRASGMQLATKPLVVTVMPSCTQAAASAAVMIGFLDIKFIPSVAIELPPFGV